jgi:phosphatidylglycerol:prolipoprotein diacylglycerol transferase
VLNLYGLLISISILLCILVAKSLINKTELKQKEEILWGLSLWAIIGGIIGARIYHVLSNLPFYLSNPLNILAIWNGGLGIWGAIVGGLVGAYLYLKKQSENIKQNLKQNFMYWLDLGSVVLPLGQAIGRWGNFFNQELFGLPTNLPWGLYIKPENRPLNFLNSNKFHPLFLYESILDLLLFFILFTLYRKYNKTTPKGIFLSLYLGGYATIRFYLEYLRVDSWKIGSLNVSQCISILVLAFSILFIKYTSSKMRKGKE